MAACAAWQYVQTVALNVAPLSGGAQLVAVEAVACSAPSSSPPPMHDVLFWVG